MPNSGDNKLIEILVEEHGLLIFIVDLVVVFFLIFALTAPQTRLVLPSG